VTCHKHDRLSARNRVHHLQQVQAAYAGQAHIQQQASGPVRFRAGQELLRRSVCLHRQSGVIQEPLQRFLIRAVVLDEIDHRFWLGCHPDSLSAAGSVNWMVASDAAALRVSLGVALLTLEEPAMVAI